MRLKGESAAQLIIRGGVESLISIDLECGSLEILQKRFFTDLFTTRVNPRAAETNLLLWLMLVQ